MVAVQRGGCSLHICNSASYIWWLYYPTKPFTYQDLDPWFSWSCTLFFFSWSFQKNCVSKPKAHKSHFSHRFTEVIDAHKLSVSSKWKWKKKRWCGPVIWKCHLFISFFFLLRFLISWMKFMSQHNEISATLQPQVTTVPASFIWTWFWTKLQSFWSIQIGSSFSLTIKLHIRRFTHKFSLTSEESQTIFKLI